MTNFVVCDLMKLTQSNVRVLRLSEELTINGHLCDHAPRFCNRQPCRCGPYRNSRPPRATATATSHSERTLCSDSIALTVHPSASVPPQITRQCVALPIGRPAWLLTAHTGAAAWYFRFLEPAQSPPSTGLARRAPCTYKGERAHQARFRVHSVQSRF